MVVLAYNNNTQPSSMHHPRRSHLKSRNGCQTCKNRRVKCDEAGPPCLNCSRRGTECQYGPPRKVKGSSPQAMVRTNEHIPEPELNIDLTLASLTIITPIRDTTELQLMHRWSTVTYLACSSDLTNDYDIWQRIVPEVALRHGFLMDTILALTAFDLAREGYQSQPQYWASTALGYQCRAINRFHDCLASSDPPSDVDIFDAKLYCSLLLMVLALASTMHAWCEEEKDGVPRARLLDQTLTHHQLIRGVQSVTARGEAEAMKNHPLNTNIPRLASLKRIPLTPETEALLDRLAQANETRSLDEVTCPMGLKDENGFHRSPIHIGCKSAIGFLRFIFLSCQDRKLRGVATSWLTMAGEDFVVALQAKDTIALLLVICWAAFCHPVGEKCWFAKDFGERLVDEVVETLDYNFDRTLCEDVVEWARQELVQAGRADERLVVDPQGLELSRRTIFDQDSPLPLRRQHRDCHSMGGIEAVDVDTSRSSIPILMFGSTGLEL